MESAIKKRSIVIGSRKTSVSLENEFWEALKDIAQSRRIPLSALVETIKAEHQQNGLSSAIRVFILNHYRKQ
jgi:predicted DNA-binding ribbon-helix-helix protein